MKICPICKNKVKSLTKDHIIPKFTGASTFLDCRVSNIKMICLECNINRAVAGHCIGALVCAIDVANDTGSTPRKVLVSWKRLVKYYIRYTDSLNHEPLEMLNRENTNNRFAQLYNMHYPVQHRKKMEPI